MADNFKTQIDKFVINTEEKLLIVVRESIEAVVDDAQKIGPSKKNPAGEGGKMRVDTGFLRSSGIAELGSIPVGAKRCDPKGKYVWNSNQLEIILAKLKIGDIFYFGWTAEYAKYREVYDGFLESAVQKWQQFVDQSVNRFKK